MIKRILLSVSLFMSLVAHAQNGTPSIYSFYGIGEVTFRGSVENRSMGGVAVFTDSIHINLQNPASYGSLKVTSFSVAATNNKTRFVTNSVNDNAGRTSIDYLAFAIPISKKFGAGIGVLPYSSVGYKLQTLASGTNTNNRRYEGSGGLNRVFFSLAYNFSENLSFGTDLQYNFGQIETSTLATIEGVQFGSREVSLSALSGFTFNTGFMYRRKVGKKNTLYSSITYTPGTSINLNNSRSIATVLIGANTENIQSETEVIVPDSKLKMPQRITFGAGFGEERHWLIGAELALTSNNGFANRFDDIQNVNYENGTKISFGGYFIPKYTAFNGYFNRVTYRAGARFEQSGLVVNGKNIEDKAVTFGLGLPLRGTFSNINLGCELGKRGTKAAGLVEERYTNISISLSLNDRWFVKRKYD
ncbi:hypothetical protein [Flavobacterium aurantiibacter]|uniref:Aromatic hydrocarbon degradation protein n=1 Tax=Flavobacterium aurantiibacter TaxID=2023067 RepID=A0A256A0J9_9FLAO|nr:hypothetical protein [Flavobacterium aurantiibacter]OYQ47202.1 hypothetical protein CHX27_03375 [Flavobacterium aurantiibacter]